MIDPFGWLESGVDRLGGPTRRFDPRTHWNRAEAASQGDAGDGHRPRRGSVFALGGEEGLLPGRRPGRPGLERRQAEGLEHVLPAAEARVVGPDRRPDRLALGLGELLPSGLQVGLLGLGASVSSRALLPGPAVGLLGLLLGLLGLDDLGELLGGLVVRPDRGDEVAGRVLADPLVLVLDQPVEDLELGPDPARRVVRDQLGGRPGRDPPGGQGLDQARGLGRGGGASSVDAWLRIRMIRQQPRATHE